MNGRLGASRPIPRIVDFRSCGMFTCGYNVYFTSAQEFTDMDARVRALGTLHLSVGGASPSENGHPMLIYNLSGDLDLTPLQGRLTVTSPSTYHEPIYSDWYLHNEKGETVSHIYLYHTQGRGVTYLFDGKPLPNANIVHVYTEVNPTKY